MRWPKSSLLSEWRWRGREIKTEGGGRLGSEKSEKIVKSKQWQQIRI